MHAEPVALIQQEASSKISCVSMAKTCCCVAQGKLLAGVNSRVHIFKWVRRDDATFELFNECTYTGHILALYMQCRGDFIIVGARPLDHHWTTEMLCSVPHRHNLP